MGSDYDVIVIGGGAAGLMCALEAGKRQRRVLVLEHANKVGKKILISGGGRCNFTNLHAAPEVYISQNRHFPISALRQYTQSDFVALVERHGIRYHEKKLGQLFCDGSATEIVAMLLRECAGGGVAIRVSCDVTDVRHENDARFSVDTSQGAVTADSLVVATGGLSIPKMGATGFAYALARKFGLGVTETRAGLVPFTFRPPALDFFNSLSGVSADSSVACNGARFRENILFTHRGLSGPAVLQASSFWREGCAVEIDLLPEVMDPAAFLEDQKVRRPRADLATVLSELLPKRLAQALCERHLPSRPLGQLSTKALRDLAQTLKRWTVTPDGTEGYRTAEVTLGGVDTRGLSSKTMEAKDVPGLFFVGEAVDVTGPLGGYNFQWAWASGYCAGQAA
jgi:predicted Rossmann fold flavoprotein